MLKKWKEKEIERLLRASDGEFVPPLSSRKSTTSSVLRSVLRNRKKTSINDYLASILRQKNIYAIQDDKMIGFLVYIN